jgi:tungstate transport system substrate-binding protein
MNGSLGTTGAGTESAQSGATVAAASRLSRRAFVHAVGAGAGVAAGVATLPSTRGAAAAAAAAALSGVVRLGAVNTPDYSGLLDEVIAEFGAQTGLDVTVYSGEDVYQRARTGAFDLIVSHYGHKDVEAFMADGLGQWPRTVFANQMAVVGPASDPAGIRGLADATEAYGRIARSGAPWVANNLPGIGYLEAILWEGAGRPAKGEWYIDTGLAQGQAIQAAARRGAYTLWGIFPFLRFLEQQKVDLEPMVLADSLLQRVMVTLVVEPQRFPAVNVEGAMALQQFLLTPAMQAHIRGFRYPGRDEQLWWPAGRHNHPSVLPESGEA